MLEASKIIEKSLILRQDNFQKMEKNEFFEELRKMRENWRVKKVNEDIFGDLGYRTCKLFLHSYINNNLKILDGPKFNSAETFTVKRKDVKVLSNNYGGTNKYIINSILQVEIPKHLSKRSTISVTIQEVKQKNFFL